MEPPWEVGNKVCILVNGPGHMARSDLLTKTFLEEKKKSVDSSETIAACDLSVIDEDN